MEFNNVLSFEKRVCSKLGLIFRDILFFHERDKPFLSEWVKMHGIKINKNMNYAMPKTYSCGRTSSCSHSASTLQSMA